VVLVAIVAVTALGTALALGVRAALMPRIRAGESVSRIQAYGISGDVAVAEGEPVASALSRAAARVAQLLSFGEKRQEEARRLLLSAGIYETRPGTFLGYRVLAGVVAGAAAMWLLSFTDLSPVLVVPLSVYGGFTGWMIPLVVVKRRARDRLTRVELEMPELIDLLVVTLEAGLGFSSALQRSAERIRGPLGEELALAQHEYGLGLTVEQSLQGMAQRCDAPAVRSFTRAITQGQALGVSVGDVMRGLAADLRKRRRQIVEERAQKAPIKMLFPLGFLILPVIFIVVLYPGLANVIDTLGS